MPKIEIVKAIGEEKPRKVLLFGVDVTSHVESIEAGEPDHRGRAEVHVILRADPLVIREVPIPPSQEISEVQPPAEVEEVTAEEPVVEEVPALEAPAEEVPLEEEPKGLPPSPWSIKNIYQE